MAFRPVLPHERAREFSARLGIRVPILLAPMSGACPPALSAAVAEAGGLGACGALLLEPAEIAAWCREFRRQSRGEFQINLWIPESEIRRDRAIEQRQAGFLTSWGPPVEANTPDAVLPEFAAQCRALLEAKPKAVSSIMGLFPAPFVADLKALGILWLATATTVAEAQAAAAAGADAIVAQGIEAGGHRGAFDQRQAERQAVGLFSLLPRISDAVSIPVIAAGGIADGRGVAAAMVLGASAVEIGTGFLRCPEAGTPTAYRERLATVEAHETVLTRAFTGRAGRAIANAYTHAASVPEAPPPAAYPIQRSMTRALREAARNAGAADRMQMWAGQSAFLAANEPAGALVERIWTEASGLLGA